jgi:hypothetical protein
MGMRTTLPCSSHHRSPGGAVTPNGNESHRRLVLPSSSRTLASGLTTSLKGAQALGGGRFDEFRRPGSVKFRPRTAYAAPAVLELGPLVNWLCHLTAKPCRVSRGSVPARRPGQACSRRSTRRATRAGEPDRSGPLSLLSGILSAEDAALMGRAAEDFERVETTTDQHACASQSISGGGLPPSPGGTTWLPSGSISPPLVSVRLLATLTIRFAR